MDPRLLYLKTLCVVGYRKLTPRSLHWTGVLIALTPITIIAFAVFVMGIFSGASAAIEGHSTVSTIAEIRAIESELWADMLTDSSPAPRVVYGLVHWFTVVLITIAVFGVRLGNAAPVLGHIFDLLSTAVIATLTVVWALQIARFLELGWRSFQGADQ